MGSNFEKKSDFLSRLATFTASTPKLAPRVPAAISDRTSTKLMFRIFLHPNTDVSIISFHPPGRFPTPTKLRKFGGITIEWVIWGANVVAESGGNAQCLTVSNFIFCLWSFYKKSKILVAKLSTTRPYK